MFVNLLRSPTGILLFLLESYWNQFASSDRDPCSEYPRAKRDDAKTRFRSGEVITLLALSIAVSHSFT